MSESTNVPHFARFADRLGKVWSISCDCPPIPTRLYDWSASDEDYDGAPDSENRHRIAYGATRAECLADIERILDEESDAD
jgi:hypothetical protein